MSKTMPLTFTWQCFKRSLHALMCLVALSCLHHAQATICNSSSQFTLGKGGQLVTSVKAKETVNLTLEIKVTDFDGLKSTGPLDGDFCSLTYLREELQTQVTSTPWRAMKIKSGQLDQTISSDCGTKTYSYSQDAKPFQNGYPSYPLVDLKDLVATVIYNKSGAINNPCKNATFYLPITLTPDFTYTDSVKIEGNDIAKIKPSGNNPSNTFEGRTLSVNKTFISCTVTAPNLDLGTFNTNAPANMGVLNGVLKSTMIGVVCSNDSLGLRYTPELIITDPNGTNKNACDPVNAATSPSNVVVRLYSSSKIDDTPNGRYCVNRVQNASGAWFSNTMTFESFNTVTYSASKPIYAGLALAEGETQLKAGSVKSTLYLNVSYP